MTTATGHAPAQLVLERAAQLAAHSDEPGRITRRLATPAWRAAGDLVLEWMRAAGMDARRDAIGNVVGRYEGEQPGAPALLLGSHLDTVPDGGRYDGALGVLVALALIERLHERGGRLPRELILYGFADEEGSRFGTTLLGSRAVVGALDAAELARTDADGISITAALDACGATPAELPRARLAADAIGYLEVHIEQGPQLERDDRPLGVVTAIAGQTRLRLALEGEAGHAGTVPMRGRRDALCAAAELTLGVEELGHALPGLVATVGELGLDPGVANVIPGRVNLTIDIRHVEDGVRQAASRQLRQRADEIASARGLGLGAVEVLVDDDATACAPAFVEALEEAARLVGVDAPRLASGAGHDAVALARTMPVGMLFVRCAGGVSHSPAESVREDDVAIAIEVLQRAVETLAAEAA